MRRACIHESAWKMMRCLDFPTIFELLKGTDGKLDDISLALFGRTEFEEFVTHVANLPHIMASEINIDPILASKIHDKIKDCFSAMV